MDAAEGKQGSRCCGEERIKDDGLSVPSPDETVTARGGRTRRLLSHTHPSVRKSPDRASEINR